MPKQKLVIAEKASVGMAIAKALGCQGKRNGYGTIFRKETANHVRKDCTAKQERNQGAVERIRRGSVEETLNELLEQEAEKLTQAARYERSEARLGYRSGHYDRNLTTTSGEVTLHVPRLKGVSFETARAVKI